MSKKENTHSGARPNERIHKPARLKWNGPEARDNRIHLLAALVLWGRGSLARLYLVEWRALYESNAGRPAIGL